MDISVVLGLVIALFAILGANYLEGGTVSSLLNLPAFLIVVGGTVGATLVSHNLEEILGLPRQVARAFKRTRIDLPAVSQRLVELSQKARREGLLALESEIRPDDDPFLARGLQLVVDGVDETMVRSILETELLLTERRGHGAAAVFETAGGYAPTMGIIGTVMGLVHVLGNMESAEALGPAIAVAFLATFYGIFTANIIWLPLASKLKARTAELMELRELEFEGIMAIQQGDNPAMVREKLDVFLVSLRKEKEREAGKGQHVA
ncbi:MAG: flagellar motor protein [Clostridiales bacterium]|nr:flagellar motor protein [Clostridiales bacterium]